MNFVSLSGIPEPYRTQLEDALNKEIKDDPRLLGYLNDALAKAAQSSINFALYGTDDGDGYDYDP